MLFDFDTLQHIIANPGLGPYSKLVFLALNQQDQQKISHQAITQQLGIIKSQVIKSIQTLIESGFISREGQQLTCHYNQQTSFCYIEDLTFGPIRKARPAVLDSVTKAREKLNELRMIGFVGVDGLIAKLAREYDQLMIKYVNSSDFSLPPNFQRAIKSKNWIHFKRLHQLLTDRQFPSTLYLESQFKAMQSNKQAGKAHPYPGMLYSTWAINNYLTLVKDSQCRETSENLFMTEDSVIRQVLVSSFGIVRQLMSSNPELSQLQSILLSQDSVSPLFLALQPEYLKFMLKYEQETSDEVLRILLRFEKSPDFKKTAKIIFDELK